MTKAQIELIFAVYWHADFVEWWGHINCQILDPAAYITDNGVSLYITCHDVVSCDSWLSATWTIHTIRQSVMVDMPAPEAAESCWVLHLSCVKWDLLWLTLPVHWGIHTHFNYTLLWDSLRCLRLTLSLHVCLVEGNQQPAHWL